MPKIYSIPYHQIKNQVKNPCIYTKGKKKKCSLSVKNNLLFFLSLHIAQNNSFRIHDLLYLYLMHFQIK